MIPFSEINLNKNNRYIVTVAKVLPISIIDHDDLLIIIYINLTPLDFSIKKARSIMYIIMPFN